MCDATADGQSVRQISVWLDKMLHFDQAVACARCIRKGVRGWLGLRQHSMIDSMQAPNWRFSKSLGTRMPYWPANFPRVSSWASISQMGRQQLCGCET